MKNIFKYYTTPWAIIANIHCSPIVWNYPTSVVFPNMSSPFEATTSLYYSSVVFPFLQNIGYEILRNMVVSTLCDYFMFRLSDTGRPTGATKLFAAFISISLEMISVRIAFDCTGWINAVLINTNICFPFMLTKCTTLCKYVRLCIIMF